MPSKLVLLVLAALTVMGCRELVAPTDGYIVVEHVLSPVRVQTRGLEGTGWIKAYLPSRQWEQIYEEPSGAFVYDQVLPPHVWHCDPVNGTEGCVAKLQVGDEVGFIGTGRIEGAIYVCTENYVQRVGRKHCGSRAFERFDPIAPDDIEPDDRVELYRDGSHGLLPSDFPNPEGFYAWHGDSMARLVNGDSYFPHAESFHPPAEGGPTARWNEFPHVTGESVITSAVLSNLSYDIGACSIFYPHEWKNRLNDVFTAQIGAFTAPLDENGDPVPNEDGSVGRGFAELLIDGILLNPPETDTHLVEDVFLWADATAVIEQRTDVSPEFHFRMGNEVPNPRNAPVPQLCLKNYMTASNDVDPGVESWYRWDQGFLGALVGVFSIGSCRRNPFSMMYCGAIGVRDGVGYFDVAPDVAAGMEGYSVFKPTCNNTFVPALLAGVKEGARTAGRDNMSEGIDRLVQGLQGKVSELFNVDFEIRRLELTPTGIYVVTANSVADPQYAYRIGNCVGDLNTPKMNPHIQPAVTTEYTTLGITRPVP